MNAVVDRLAALPSSLMSVRRARQFVREALAAYLPPAELDTVELLTSEVVTNAVVHAGSNPTIEVATDGGTVRVSVEDRDPGWPMAHAVPADATSGRGMALVDALAHAWGVESLAGRGKTIWFEVRSGR